MADLRITERFPRNGSDPSAAIAKTPVQRICECQAFWRRDQIRMDKARDNVVDRRYVRVRPEPDQLTDSRRSVQLATSSLELE